jgi:hypothetical protein
MESQFVTCARRERTLVTSVQHQSLFSEQLWDFAQVVHVYDFLVVAAGRVGELANAKAR